jgi:hypothetical protein
MLRKIEYLIPAALEAIDEVFQAEIGKDGIPSGYQSAASGFGTTLLQMGLLPTLAVYTDEGSDADIVRKELLKALLYIVKHADSRFGAKDQLGQVEALLRTARQPAFPQEEFKEHLLQASVAFKLAIRTYKLK